MKKLVLFGGVLLVHFQILAQCGAASSRYAFTVNGKNYELVRLNQTWSGAAQCALQSGGYLAHIDSEAENTAIFNELSSPAAGITLNQTIANDGGGGAYVWIGGNDLNQEGGWRWDGDNLGGSIPFWNGNFNGTNVVGSYQNWGVDDAGSQAEPDNFNNNQDALGFALTQWPRSTTWFLGSAGQWNDVSAANRLYYLVEFNGTSCIETTSSVTTSSCDLYTSPSGKLWTTSGVYNDTIPNAAGCDSVMTINLTILSETQSTIFETPCDSFTSPSGMVLTTSGIYIDTIPNAAGCDSIITIDLQLRKPSNSEKSISSCNEFISPTFKVWTTSGIYYDTLSNNVWCDSIIKFNLTILSSTSSTSSINTCDPSYMSPSGKIWTTSGAYNDTIPNAAGCDSVITINLTITSINTDVTKLKDTLTAESSQGGYQWLDCEDNYAMITGANEQSYVPDEDGEYAVEITQSGCVDTSDCLLLILSSIEDIQERSVKLYPNPTIDNIQLEIEEGVDVEWIWVVDMQGKEHTVDIKKESGTRYRVNLHELSAGIYSIVVQTPAGQIIKQVQKL